MFPNSWYSYFTRWNHDLNSVWTYKWPNNSCFYQLFLPLNNCWSLLMLLAEVHLQFFLRRGSICDNTHSNTFAVNAVIFGFNRSIAVFWGVHLTLGVSMNIHLFDPSATVHFDVFPPTCGLFRGPCGCCLVCCHGVQAAHAAPCDCFYFVMEAVGTNTGPVSGALWPVSVHTGDQWFQNQLPINCPQRRPCNTLGDHTHTHAYTSCKYSAAPLILVGKIYTLDCVFLWNKPAELTACGIAAPSRDWMP